MRRAAVGWQKAEVANKEDLRLVDLFAGDAMEFVEQECCWRSALIGAQSVGADGGAVVDLDGGAGRRGARLAVALQSEDLVDEVLVHPGFGLALCLLAGDDRGSGFFHRGVPAFT